MAKYNKNERAWTIKNMLVDVEEDLCEPVRRPANDVAHDDGKNHFWDATVGFLARFWHA